MSRYVAIGKFVSGASKKLRQPSSSTRFASTVKQNDRRPPLVGQRPVQPPEGGVPCGPPMPNIPPRTNILDLTCQPCEFPPPTTRTPYRKPVAVNFANRKTSISHRDDNTAAADTSKAQSGQHTSKEKAYRAMSDKTSKELVARLQISTRTLAKTNDSLASCFKTGPSDSRGGRMNK